MGGWQGSRDGQEGGFKFLNREVKGCIRPSYGPRKSLNWEKCREIYSRHLYSTPQRYTAMAKPPFGHQTARTDHHCFSEKQPAKALVLNTKCSSLFMCHSVYDEKLNLLTWAIRLIRPSQISWQQYRVCCSTIMISCFSAFYCLGPYFILKLIFAPHMDVGKIIED